MNSYQKAVATHLTELRDPKVDRDPQFGKCCDKLYFVSPRSV